MRSIPLHLSLYILSEKSALMKDVTLIVGDSTIARMDASVVENAFAGTVLNLAVSGQTTEELINNFAQSSPPQESYNTVVVVTGKNDYFSKPVVNINHHLHHCITEIRSIVGKGTRLFIVGIGFRACACNNPTVAARSTSSYSTCSSNRRVKPCCDTMEGKRKLWSNTFNTCLASLSTTYGFQYIPSPTGVDGWTWDDGIHLAATEHKRYIGHIAARMAAKD